MAQVYNHIIMPLASERDARTQIRWGIADFESPLRPQARRHVARRDRRQPPRPRPPRPGGHQVHHPRPRPVRPRPPHPPTRTSAADRSLAASLPTAPWTETPNATVDPTHPYTVQLDEGRSIAVFFYDGPASRAIAFEGLLNSGEDFGRRLSPASTRRPTGAKPSSPTSPPTAKATATTTSTARWPSPTPCTGSTEGNQADLTNYGEFLDKFPPQWQAEVVEDTSWSCIHGVERWRSNCGCNGGKPGWNQEWRGPLRNALDFLRDATAPLAEKLAEGLLKDLWTARDAYIHVILDRTNTDQFFAEHATHTLTPAERITVLELLELERHTQLMYTSCGWFFDEVSGIETVQIIAYAGRVLQLAAKLFGAPGAALEEQFLAILETAKSTSPRSAPEPKSTAATSPA